MKRFGEKLRTLRQNRAWTQQELATKLGAGRIHISNLEHNKKAPSVEMVIKVSDLFGVSADVLIRDELNLDESPSGTQLLKDEVLVKRFGEKLRTLRQNRAWTQQQLADEMGIGRAHVSDMERNAKLPSVEMLVKLTRLFAISADSLIHDEVELGESPPWIQPLDD